MKESDAILILVKEGVRRFIVEGAPLETLKQVVLTATKAKGVAHPLTGAVFRRIVKEAIRERKRITRNR